MSLKLEDVKGLGKRAEILRTAGIDTVEKLATAKIEDLLEIKGIGKTSAQKYIDNANLLLKKEGEMQDIITEKKLEKKKDERDEKIEEEAKRMKEKQKILKDRTVEKGDFVLVKITGKTQKGNVFQVSSEEDAKKAGIFDENKAKQGYYSPEFIIVGRPGFLNEGLTETIEKMKFFEKKSVRIPPGKAFGKRDPQKIERIGIAKFRKLNDGKNPELGQEFVKKGTGQRGVVTNVVQGRVIIDYNHPLAGQSVDYNIEIIDKIEEFNEKVEFFMLSKGIPKESISDFNLMYNKEDKSLEITIPKTFLFQNLTYLKFGLAYDLQTHMPEEINDVKFIEVYEKMPLPTMPEESVQKKIEEYNQENDHEH